MNRVIQKINCVFIVLLSLANPLYSQDKNDDTISFYLSKSDIVLAVALSSNPYQIQHAPNDSYDYEIHSKVEKILYKRPLKGKTVMDDNLYAFPMPKVSEDFHFFAMVPDGRSFKSGSRCIVFLKASHWKHPYWFTADIWFGLQPYSDLMEKSVQESSKKAP